MIGFKKLWGKHMENATEQYKGYTLAVTAIQDNGDLWDFEYRISSGGQSGAAPAAITRSKTAGGYNTAAIACTAGLQVARTEVDNLLALAGTSHQSS